LERDGIDVGPVDPGSRRVARTDGGDRRRLPRRRGDLPLHLELVLRVQDGARRLRGGLDRRRLLLTILALIAERRDDPVELATVARQAAYVGERVFAPASLVVLLMGIAMMLNTDWGWGQFWVVFGLLGFLSTFTIGIGVLSPLAKRIVASMEESGPHSPETQALIKRILLIARVDTAVLLLVIVDMVTKPFS
jgi:uncharacterized membrane protein